MANSSRIRQRVCRLAGQEGVDQAGRLGRGAKARSAERSERSLARVGWGFAGWTLAGLACRCDLVREGGIGSRRPAL